MQFVANSDELGLRAAVCCVLLSIQYRALLFCFSLFIRCCWPVRWVCDLMILTFLLPFSLLCVVVYPVHGPSFCFSLFIRCRWPIRCVCDLMILIFGKVLSFC